MATDKMDSALEALLRKVVAERFAAVEEMCERSITDGRGYGVRVTDGEFGEYFVELAPDVPFGEVESRYQAPDVKDSWR